MFALAVQSGTTFFAGRPQVLSESGTFRQIAGTRPSDLAPDRTFVIIQSAQEEAAGATASDLVVGQNWSRSYVEEIKRLVPTN